MYGDIRWTLYYEVAYKWGGQGLGRGVDRRSGRRTNQGTTKEEMGCEQVDEERRLFVIIS